MSVFNGGTDFAECGVEFGFRWCEVGTERSFDEDELGALDTDVAQVVRSGNVAEQGGEITGLEGVGVVTGAVD
jgi:hypothetical protein